MYSLTLTEEQKDDILTALLEYRDSISKFDQFSVECERMENLIDLVTWLKPIKDETSEEKIKELENQLRIRGNMLKATERKVEELYELLGK